MAEISKGVFDLGVLAKRLREEREKKGLTQSELAKKIGKEDGASYISNIETEKNAASIDALFDIANVLDVPLDYLCGRDAYIRGNATVTEGDIARAFMALYFTEGFHVEVRKETVPPKDGIGEGVKRSVTTVQCFRGNLRRFMRDFDDRMTDRRPPDEVMGWVNRKLKELDENIVYDMKNAEKWGKALYRMTWKNLVSEEEFTERIWGKIDLSDAEQG